MGKLNQIKLKLLAMEGGKFHRLCDDWLRQKGYRNIKSIGMMATTDRVIKGTPDSLFTQPNGNYVFAEYSVQNRGLANKLKADISKCFDENKTGISNEQIDKIIICYLGELSTHEIRKLRDSCNDRGTSLSLKGLDELAHSIQNDYPILSERHLDLPLDTGQLLPVDDFIIQYEKNRLTPPIKNDILFQEDALKKATSELNSANFLLVSGAAGVGKTLFSVNLLKEMQLQNENLIVLCLFDKNLDLFQDAMTHFSDPGDYLLFIDDANRLNNRVDYLLDYLHQNDSSRTFRIVATVRDYVRKWLMEKVNQFTEIRELFIEPLSDNQIKELTGTLFGIKNFEAQNRIEEIALGNPRLAVMASEKFIEENQIDSIQNVASLFDEYFRDNVHVKDIIEDEKLMTAACAVSFFRKVDKSNKVQMQCIHDSFGIQPEEFWELIRSLHNNEVVDFYENEVVKISDQSLSTYLFYISVFKKRVVSLSVILNDFYPDFTQTIVDSLYPVLSSFDQYRIVSEIRNEVRTIFRELSNDNDESIEFLNTFWFALPTEALSFADRVISQIPVIEIDWSHESFDSANHDPEKSSLVELLGKFRYYDEEKFKKSFDLLLNYLEKDRASLEFVVRNLTEYYNIKTSDLRNGYVIQKYIVGKLIEKMDEGRSYLFTRLFILVAKDFLKTKLRDHPRLRGEKMYFVNFSLVPDNYLLPLREKLIINLSDLMKKNEYKVYIIELLRGYVDMVMHEEKEIVEADLPFFIDHLVVVLDRNDVSHCLIMQDYCENLESLQLHFPIGWKKEFLNDTLTLPNLLLGKRHEQRMFEMSHEEYNQYRHESIVDYFSNIPTNVFIDFIDRCKVLHEVLSGWNDHSLKQGLEKCFRAMAEVEPEMYPELVSRYLEYDCYFKISPYAIVSDLFNVIPSNEVLFLLKKTNYKRKNLWISAYFVQFPEESITKHDSDFLIEHTSNTLSNELFEDLDFLDRYKRVDTDIYSKVVSILVRKCKEDGKYARPLVNFIRIHPTIFGEWFNESLSDKELVFDAYIAAISLYSGLDSSGEALRLLTERNFEFLFRVIDQVYEEDNSLDLNTHMPKLNYLWERDSYIEDIESYGKYLMKKNQSSFRRSIFSNLFIQKSGKLNPEELTDKKKLFFIRSIQDNATDINYMCFIFQTVQLLGKDFIREFLESFIKKNVDLNNFKTLVDQLTKNTWCGSRVPIFEKEKKILESLLPIFTGIELLGHEGYVERQIEAKTESIEREKKRDFLES